MCGIAAFVGLGDGRDLTSMMDALRHRSPDGDGAFVDTSTGLHLYGGGTCPSELRSSVARKVT